MKMKRRLAPCMVAMLPVSAFTEEKKAGSKTVTVPAGTRMMVETLDHLDSSRQKAGHRFRAKLAGDLVVEGKVVAPGSQVKIPPNTLLEFNLAAPLTATLP